MKGLIQFRVEKAEMIISSGPDDHNPVRVQIAPGLDPYHDRVVPYPMFYGKEQSLLIKPWAVLSIDWEELIDRHVTTMVTDWQWLVTAKSRRPGTSYVVEVRKV